MLKKIQNYILHKEMSLSVPPSLLLSPDEIIKLRTQRLLSVTCALDDLRKEHEDLQKSISELKMGYDCTPQYQKRWDETLRRLEKILNTFFTQSSTKKNQPQLNECTVRLRKSVGLKGSVFDWELRLPEEAGFGIHHHIISLNHLRLLPAAYDEEASFVRWLSEKRLIEIETKLEV